MHLLYVLILTHVIGGLVAIGLFLMRWSPDESLSRFEYIAVKTFETKLKNEKSSLIQYVRRLWGTFIQDCRYDSSIIGKAFRTPLGVSPAMFNPLQCDTRVAVTTTTARKNFPCLLSNYNGSQRSKKNSKSELFSTYLSANIRSVPSRPRWRPWAWDFYLWRVGGRIM